MLENNVDIHIVTDNDGDSDFDCTDIIYETCSDSDCSFCKGTWVTEVGTLLFQGIMNTVHQHKSL